MIRNINIEAEGGEIVIQNENGDYAVIPKSERKRVESLIEDDCHGCIDEFVSTLPVMSNYAQDGTLLTGIGDDPNKPIAPVAPPMPLPVIQTFNFLPDPNYIQEYKQRTTDYGNNPKGASGVPTLGGDYRKLNPQESTNLLKAYEGLSQKDITPQVLEEYQALKQGTYYVSSDAELLPTGFYSQYLNKPVNLTKYYSGTAPTTSTTQPQPVQQPQAPFVYTDPYTGKPLYEYTEKMRALGVELPETGTQQLPQGASYSAPEVLAEKKRSETAIEANKQAFATMSPEQQQTFLDYNKDKAGSSKLTATEWLQQFGN